MFSIIYIWVGDRRIYFTNTYKSNQKTMPEKVKIMHFKSFATIKFS